MNFPKNSLIQRGLRRAAFTIVELSVSMAIGTICLGAVGVIYVTMAKEHRTGLADAVLSQRVDNLEDRLTQLLRTMSATTGATLGSVNPTNSGMYQKVVFNKGSGTPQQSITFNQGTGTVIYDPNTSVAGNEQTLFASEAGSVMLRNFYFTLGLQQGGRPDASLLGVTMDFDDDKASRRRSGSNYKVNAMSRQFSVRLRGP